MDSAPQQPYEPKHWHAWIFLLVFIVAILVGAVTLVVLQNSSTDASKSKAVLNAEEQFRSNYNVNQPNVPNFEGTSPAQITNLASLSVALKQYKDKNGKYPDSLSALANFLPQSFYQSISIDPYSNQPFRYEIKENGTDYNLCAKTPSGYYCTSQAWLLDNSTRQLE
jgi:hypothetical protein